MSIFKVSTSDLVKVFVTTLRDRDTASAGFRRALEVVTTLLLADVLASMPTELDQVEIVTPLEVTSGHLFPEVSRISFVPILRAGAGMVSSATILVPNAPVFYVGLRRDEKTAKADWYYNGLPDAMHTWAIILDPMLATGGSAIQVIDVLKGKGTQKISLVSIIGSRLGAETVRALYPDVEIYLAALDEELDVRKYIVPGLGDAGDRIHGT